jgi:hypothetical protein
MRFWIDFRFYYNDLRRCDKERRKPGEGEGCKTRASDADAESGRPAQSQPPP